MTMKSGTSPLIQATQEIMEQEEALRRGGGKRGLERQRKLGRLPVRERLDLLLDAGTSFTEIGLWAAYGMYEEWGELPAAGVVTGIGRVSGRDCMVVANDATVKAGAMFPQSVKKVLRAQRIAYSCQLPIVYLVDSSGVFLPLQDEIFPDDDDFGRIFRNNSIFSARGLPQYAAVMGNCIAGGAYLPVLCDKLLMTEGSGLYLAGPALVKAAIGQTVEAEELGGAKMHSAVSGTVDFVAPDDPSCIVKLRELIGLLKEDPANPKGVEPERPATDLYDIVGGDGRAYDGHDLISCIVDKHSMQEYKADYGKALITCYARIDGRPVGIVANTRQPVRSETGGIEIGGVIYAESADKAARFVMDCNQTGIPLIFFQDVFGFMVGKEAEQSGIIRCGAKLVNAVSNSIVPKITIVVGNSFGAGNYALCGKAYDPTFIMAWPGTHYAVMGAEQAAGTLFTIQEKAAQKRGEALSDTELEEMHQKVHERYSKQADIRYGAARMWIDGIIAPETTRANLINLLRYCTRGPARGRPFETGVFQV